MLPKRKPRRSKRGRRSPRAENDYAFCPFCGVVMDFSRMAGVQGALAKGEDVSADGGTLVNIDLCGMGIPAVVAAPGSPLTRDGFQVVFLVCGNECAKSIVLMSALDSMLAGRDPDLSQPNALFGLRVKKDAETDERRVAEMMDALMRALTPEMAERLESEMQRLSIVH